MPNSANAAYAPDISTPEWIKIFDAAQVVENAQPLSVTEGEDRLACALYNQKQQTTPGLSNAPLLNIFKRKSITVPYGANFITIGFVGDTLSILVWHFTRDGMPFFVSAREAYKDEEQHYKGRLMG